MSSFIPLRLRGSSDHGPCRAIPAESTEFWKVREMTVADVTYALFTAFNGVRIVSYLPQILRVARDSNGASAISYATWLLWTAANATTGLYAQVNLDDPTLALLNL